MDISCNADVVRLRGRQDPRDGIGSRGMQRVADIEYREDAERAEEAALAQERVAN